MTKQEFELKHRLYRIGKALQWQQDPEEYDALGRELVKCSGVCTKCGGDGFDGDPPDYPGGPGGSVYMCASCNGSGFVGSALTEQRVLTCVYCGQEYPQDTPASGSEVLTEHIKVCEKHPMRQLELDKADLVRVLSKLIGCSTQAEVNEMESMLRLMNSGIEEDRIAAINALAVLKRML